MALEVEKEGQTDEEGQAEVECEYVACDEESEGGRQDQERQVRAPSLEQQDPDAPGHQKDPRGEQDLSAARSGLVESPDRQGGRRDPIDQRRLVEEDRAIDARRDEIAPCEHLACHVGVAAFVPLPQTPGGKAEQQEKSEGTGGRPETRPFRANHPLES